jgi:RecB family exonuclease
MAKVNNEFLKTAETNPAVPYLSHSRVNRYLFCPEQYRLHYVENLRPLLPSANLHFGKAIHAALASLYEGNPDVGNKFHRLWEEFRGQELKYGYRDSWDSLHEKGQQLIELYVQNEWGTSGTIRSVEEKFTLTLSNLDVPFVGIIDLMTVMEEAETVIDFKTSGSSYAKHEVDMSDQLTAYQLAKPSAELIAFCVLIKTKEPRIEWHFAKRRSGDHLTAYLHKVEMVGKALQRGEFYKRPGKWCSYCDFLPVCQGNACIQVAQQQEAA